MRKHVINTRKYIEEIIYDPIIIETITKELQIEIDKLKLQLSSQYWICHPEDALQKFYTIATQCGFSDIEIKKLINITSATTIKNSLEHDAFINKNFPDDYDAMVKKNFVESLNKKSPIYKNSEYLHYQNILSETVKKIYFHNEFIRILEESKQNFIPQQHHKKI